MPHTIKPTIISITPHIVSIDVDTNEVSPLVILLCDLTPLLNSERIREKITQTITPIINPLRIDTPKANAQTSPIINPIIVL